MLVAYGPANQVVDTEETSLEQIQQWSQEHLLHCPNCRGSVHVRGGPEKRTQLHFAHQKGECAWSTEAESVRHMRGKAVIANWLRTQFPEARVSLEERLPEPNRIADVFLMHASGERWAVEFQCAPLDLEEWRHRHEAYRAAEICDIWIIGNNRREKQEAFIEAILAFAREILFLDPLQTPARVWLRWPISYTTIQEWQRTQSEAPPLGGWVGHLGHGASLGGRLSEIQLGAHGQLLFSLRQTFERRLILLQRMSLANEVDEKQLSAYLYNTVSEEALRVVLLPLMRAYRSDPELLRRYNYGRGTERHPLEEEERQRVQKACAWLVTLAQRGFSPDRLQETIKALPFAGPYAAFARYAEMLLAISSLDA